MKTKWIGIGVVFCAILCVLQIHFAYFFYFKEQLGLFLWTSIFAKEQLFQPGGLAIYVAGFIQQFYAITGFGAAMTALLLSSVALLTSNVLAHRYSSDWNVYDCLALFPVLYLLYLHTDSSYHLAGTLSLLFCLSGWRAYQYIEKSKWRFIAAIGLICFEYIVAGSYFSLFTAGIILLEIYRRNTYCAVTTASALLTMLTIAAYAFYSDLQTELRFIFLPDYYYEPLLPADKTHYLWIIILSTWVVAFFIRKTAIKPMLSYGIGILLLTGGVWQLCHSYTELDLYKYERDYYLKHHQWERILATFSSSKASVQTMNVLNLALACDMQLGERMFAYPQEGPESLFRQWDSTLEDALIFSEICYQVGDIASAMKFAFEGYISTPLGNPVLLQMLIKTNIIAGSYPVAEKYISLLEKTWAYKDWASSQRMYLSDEGLEQQTEYLARRKDWRGSGLYAMSSQVVPALKQLYVHQPKNKMALQYLTGYLLLNRNLNVFREFYNEYYGKSEWQDLSTYQQEAIVALEQSHPGRWAKMGVSMRVEQAYAAFSQDMADKHTYINFEEEMKKAHGSSYWYYLMFKKKGAKK